jgi:1,4-alpha-glucan branching enzyme
MHDTLAYMATPAEHRGQHHGKLTFGLVYAFSENFILSLSHDEVVHMKRSLLEKMPGERWEKFANLRLLYTLMYGHPGKKLLFMGGEFGQREEWDHSRSLSWACLAEPEHRGLSRLVEKLNQLYRAEPTFFEVDFKHAGFEWLDVDSAADSTLAFLRKGRDPRNALLFVFNCSGISRPWHRVGVPYPVTYRELFDSNAREFGGSGGARPPRTVTAEEIPWHGRDFSIALPLPAFTGLVLKPDPPAGKSEA